MTDSTASWVAEFDDHPVHTVLATSYGHLESLDGMLNGEDDARGQMDRVRRALDYVRSRLARADKPLAVGSLNNLKGTLDQVVNPLSRAVGQKTKAQLPNVVTQIPNLMQHTQAIVVLEGEVDVKRLADAQEHLSTATDEVVSGLRESLSEERERYAALETKTTAAKAKVVELTTTIDGQKARLDEVIATFQKQFSDAEATRATANETKRGENDKEFKEDLTELEARFDSSIKTAEDDFTTRRDENSKASNKLIERMEESETKAKELLGIATNIAVTGEFQKTAEAEGKAANLWRKWALFFNVVLVVALGYFVYETSTDGYKWELTASRLVMLGMLLFPARYAAKESTKHRDNERRNRTMQLKLASIEPYLETLPPEEAQKLKVELAQKFFGDDRGPNSESKEAAGAEFGGMVKMFGLVNRYLPKP